jgi:hypothetical protein
MTLSGQIRQRVKLDIRTTVEASCVKDGFGWLWNQSGKVDKANEVGVWTLAVGSPDAFDGGFTDHYPGGSQRTDLTYDTVAADSFNYAWVPARGKITLFYSSNNGKDAADPETATRLVITADLTFKPMPASEFANSAAGASSNLATHAETIKGTWTCGH